MEVPQSLLESLKDVKGFDREAFEKVHASGEQVTSIRINPLKVSVVSGEWSMVNGESSITPDSRLLTPDSRLLTPIPWTQYGYYLSQRPSFTFDPLFHAGCYYVQEASSMFIEQALCQTADLSKPLKILDLSAAPGGKSTHIQSLISPDSLLVSNEVIRSRAQILKDNIIKWGAANVMVTNNDPADFSKLENYFDIIVVDAPCSGSGLFRRDPEAIAEWSLNNVQLCSQRQQRILADVWPALKKDGILIYSTCSYSREEDEEIVNWLTNEFTVQHIPLNIQPPWGIIESGGGYRFWPDKLKGEGFFISSFKKNEGGTTSSLKIKTKPPAPGRTEIATIGKWIKQEGNQFVKYLNTIYAWPEKLVADFSFLLQELRVIYSGTRTGELIRDKLVPDHALAMSNLAADNTGKINLEYEQAILYLQRKDLQLDNAEKGWRRVQYEGNSLGWVNVLTNRINNYYPKEMRILKDSK